MPRQSRKERMEALYKKRKEDLVRIAKSTDRVSDIDKTTPKGVLISMILEDEYGRQTSGKNPTRREQFEKRVRELRAKTDEELVQIVGFFNQAPRKKMIEDILGKEGILLRDPDSVKNPKVHPQAVESLKRYKSDLKAGHLDAAEYWRGQAGAYFTANPNVKVGYLVRSSQVKEKDLYGRVFYPMVKITSITGSHLEVIDGQGRTYNILKKSLTEAHDPYMRGRYGTKERFNPKGQAGAYFTSNPHAKQKCIFIRPVTKSEKTGSHYAAFLKIPDKTGYRKVYMPYGEEGAGFYYIKETNPKGIPHYSYYCPVCKRYHRPGSNIYYEHRVYALPIRNPLATISKSSENALMKSVIEKIANVSMKPHRKPTKADFKRWSKMPDPFEGITEEMREKAFKKGCII